MKCVKITPRPLMGSLIIPPSKSISHRAIICAGLSDGISNIDNIAFSKDIIATLDAMNSFGVYYKVINENIDKQTNKISICGRKKLRLINNHIDYIESGSTLRFIIPIACLLGENVTLR